MFQLFVNGLDGRSITVNIDHPQVSQSVHDYLYYSGPLGEVSLVCEIIKESPSVQDIATLVIMVTHKRSAVLHYFFYVPRKQQFENSRVRSKQGLELPQTTND